MPHKYYHGCVVRYDDNIIIFTPFLLADALASFTTLPPHAVGVIVNKVVGNRYIEKRVNIRVEHVRHSKCRQEFVNRVKQNSQIRAEAKEKGGESSHSPNCRFSVLSAITLIRIESVPSLRRVQAAPRDAHVVSSKDNAPQTLAPIAYDTSI